MTTPTVPLGRIVNPLVQNVRIVDGATTTGGLTDAQLRATAVPVSFTTGTVSVSNFPATQPVSIAATVPVSGTFWQATQPVSAASLPLPTGAATELTLARRFGLNAARITRASQITTIGDNTVYTPAAGKKIRLHWIGMASSQNNAGETLAQIRLGATVLYRWPMGNPGAFSHYEVADSAINETLVVNLSVAYPVEVNYTVEEV